MWLGPAFGKEGVIEFRHGFFWRHLSSIHTAAGAKCQAGFRESAPLEGFLLHVKDPSFIHQRFTVCHPLF